MIFELKKKSEIPQLIYRISDNSKNQMFCNNAFVLKSIKLALFKVFTCLYMIKLKFAFKKFSNFWTYNFFFTLYL
jgi:hypothetical protein